MPKRLAERLLTAARNQGFSLDSRVYDELNRRLAAAVHETPGVTCDPQQFCEGLVARLAQAEDAHTELGRLHVEDMYFVWALAQGMRSAVQRFERTFSAPIPAQVAAPSEVGPGELLQQVRMRLLVSEDEKPPRITQYAGRGPFGAWLRMVAKRIALDLVRARGAAVPDLELASPSVATNPELDYLKLRYAADFKAVLEHALSQLTPRQVTLIKLSSLEQLAPSAIGVMYGVSARTVQRWLADLKDEVLHRTREGLRERLSLQPAELESLLGLMQSQLHVSLHRVFQSP